MSATLLFLLPIGLVAVVWSLCFVGACFPTSGLPGSSTPYSDLVLNESGILAYWPLSEPQGATQAKDITGNGHDGTYSAGLRGDARKFAAIEPASGKSGAGLDRARRYRQRQESQLGQRRLRRRLRQHSVEYGDVDFAGFAAVHLGSLDRARMERLEVSGGRIWCSQPRRQPQQ